MSSNPFESIRDKASASSAKGAPSGPKKKMTPAELSEYLKKKNKAMLTVAEEAAKGNNAVMTTGKRPVKLWEAEVERLVMQVDAKGDVKVMYNHGTREKPDLHEECYILPLCRVSKSNMARGIGVKYEGNADKAQPSKGPRDWSLIMGLVLGLPIPADILRVNPSAPLEQERGMAFVRAREEMLALRCATDDSIYPDVRDKDERTSVANTLSLIENPTAEQVLGAKKNFWKAAVKRGTSYVKEKTSDGKDLSYIEFKVNSYTFFKQFDGRKEEMPAEVSEALATPTEQWKVEQAKIIKSAYDEGYKLSRLRVQDLDGKPIEASIFACPLHDNDLVLPLVSMTWYSQGTNRGCSVHPMLIRLVDSVARSHAQVNVDTVAYAQTLKRRSALEIRILRAVKAYVHPGGLAVEALIEENSTTEPADLSAALNSLVKDRLIQPGMSRTHFEIVNKDLNIDDLPIETEAAEDLGDFAKVVAEARARLEKKRVEDAHAEAERKAAEAAAAAKQKQAAEVAAALTGPAAAAAGPSNQAGQSMKGYADNFAANLADEEEEAPVSPPPQKRQKTGARE